MLRGTGLRLPLVAVALAMSVVGAAGAAAKVPPLYDPVFLNIGFVCQWQESCMNKQKKAMKRAIEKKVGKPAPVKKAS